MGRKKVVSDDELLEVARQLFTRHGSQASTKEIARQAGLSEAALFQRYRTKAELFFAAMTPPPVNLDSMFVVPEPLGDVLGCLEELTLALLAYFRQATPVMVHLHSHPSFSFERFATEHPEHGYTALRNRLGLFLHELQRKGGLGPVDVRPLALILFTSTYSIAQFEALGVHGGHMPEQFVRGMVRTLWQGIAPQPIR